MVAGTHIFQVRVTDANDYSTVEPYSVWIGKLVTIAPATLPVGTKDVPYAQTLTFRGGTPPYEFVFDSESDRFPTGLRLEGPTNGRAVLKGTPKEVGTFTFTAIVRDSSTCWPNDGPGRRADDRRFARPMLRNRTHGCR